MASSSSSSTRARCGTINREGSPRWVRIPASDVAPEGRIGHTLCTNTEEDKVILYGGVTDCEDGSSKYLDDLFVYDFPSKVWQRIEVTGSKQQPRAFHTAVYWGDRMFVFGGCNGRGRFNRLFSINPVTGLCEQPEINTSPATRYCHSAAVFNDGMYVFGGKCGGRNSNKRLEDLWVYNFSENLWSEVQQTGSRPSPRSAHAAFTFGRTMVVFGGRSEVGECCEDMYYFHYDTHVWRQVDTTESLFGRARHSFVVHNSRVVVFGGWNGKKKLSDLFYYNMDSGTFEVVGDTDENGPSRRECHVAVMCKNTMVVFGGRFRNDFMNTTSELELGAKPLKEMCRDWLLLRANPLTIETVPPQCIPARLLDFFTSYRAYHAIRSHPAGAVANDETQPQQQRPQRSLMFRQPPPTYGHHQPDHSGSGAHINHHQSHPNHAEQGGAINPNHADAHHGGRLDDASPPR